MSRVDVIIPCYKYAHYLRGCVQSILSQPVDVRVLIIDDCSPDNTQEVGCKLAAEDSRVEYRRHEINKGHIATYNEGFEWASSEYTLLISADDLLAPNALHRAVRLLDAHPEVGFVHGRVIKFTSADDLPTSDDHPLECNWQVINGREWLEAMCKETVNHIFSPEVVVRTRLQHELGGYRSELPHSADLEMWMRFAAHSDIGVLDAEQAYYRVHTTNMHVLNYKSNISEWQQRRLAFEWVFREYGKSIDGADRLARLWTRSLAWVAVWDARTAYASGNVDLARDLLEFAVTTYRGARWWRAYVKTSVTMKAGTALKSMFRRPGSSPIGVSRSVDVPDPVKVVQ